MPDKRGKPRYRKRLRVLYGPEIPSKVGFTSNVSETGLCIQNFVVYPPGTMLLMEAELPDGEIVRMEGRVQWARKVPPALLRKVKYAGMGIRIVNFIGSGDPFVRYCQGSPDEFCPEPLS
ncbi:MAG: pilus assembly protein PilZ [Desulfuromonadaceae bacterium]|nr:pilus assembly protein PilZ [Desulfuromonadaceae bacterium]